MAYDSRQLRTLKWCEGIAKDSRFDMMMYCGSIYVTDEYILAKIDYPEFYHLSEWEWSRITRYTDDEGYLLKVPETELLERQFFNNRIFDDMFHRQLHRFECVFNPKLMRKILKPFEINCIFPTITTSETSIELSGHNSDVSIRALMMGVGNNSDVSIRALRGVGKK